MTADLEDLKKRIRTQYLGRGGIHGVGMSRSRNVVRLYVNDASDLDPDLLEEVTKGVSPFGLEVIKEQSPSATKPRTSISKQRG